MNPTTTWGTVFYIKVCVDVRQVTHACLVLHLQHKYLSTLVQYLYTFHHCIPDMGGFPMYCSEFEQHMMCSEEQLMIIL